MKLKLKFSQNSKWNPSNQPAQKKFTRITLMSAMAPQTKRIFISGIILLKFYWKKGKKDLWHCLTRSKIVFTEQKIKFPTVKILAHTRLWTNSKTITYLYMDTYIYSDIYMYHIYDIYIYSVYIDIIFTS